jgi:hypothetical protein
MPKETLKDLIKFLGVFPEQTKETVLWLREYVWDQYPKTNELIYDNYNAVSLGWSLTDKLSHLFCTIAIFRTNHSIHFGFYWGNEIADPEKLLLGEGKQYRYIIVKDKKGFPKTYMKKLIKEAYANSLGKLKDGKQQIFGKTITKSVSAKKRK